MKERDELLDWVRGGSALFVLAAHLRGFLFVDFAALSDPSFGARAFYLLTTLHHEAVMVFFVLSGYFVGGAVLRAVNGGGMSWKAYAVARLTRLWVVLLPAMLLTLLCDRIGMHFAPGAYAGGFHALWQSGPTPLAGGDYGVTAFAGNTFFLQTITTPVFGTNGPLWSLAYEFWYYVLFPLIVVAARKARQRETGAALLYFLLVSGLIVWLPEELLAKGLIWLMGVGVAAWRDRFGRLNLREAWQRWLVTGGALLFLAALAWAKLRPGYEMDFLVGGIFALWMLVLPARQTFLRFLEPVGKFLAEISYTLYVTHFPLLFFLSAVVMKGKQFDSIGSGAGVYTVFLFAALLLATLFWWAFERRTEAVRRAVDNRSAA